MFHKKNIALLFLLCLKLSQINTMEMEKEPSISECEIPNVQHTIKKCTKPYNLISNHLKPTFKAKKINFSSPSSYDIGIYNIITPPNELSDHYLNELCIIITFEKENCHTELTCELKEKQEDTPKKINLVDIEINNWEISRYTYNKSTKQRKTEDLEFTNFEELLKEISEIPELKNPTTRKGLSKKELV